MTDFSNYTLGDIKNMQNINTRDEKNSLTVLMYMCDKQDVESCQYLFNNNVNFKALDVKEGEDAFYHLIVNKYSKKLRNIAKMFYQAGYIFNPNKIINASHGTKVMDINKNVKTNIQRLKRCVFKINIIKNICK